MAQPSVAREPSMEEILASIRRIIESNEPDPARTASAAQPAFDDYEEPEADPRHDVRLEEDEDIRLTIEDQLPAFSPAATSRPDPVAAEPQETAVPMQAASPTQAAMQAPARQEPPVLRKESETRSISLADVAARVRAASERVPAELVRAAEPPVLQSRPVELRPSPAVAAAPAPTRAAEPAPRPVSQPQQPARAELEMRPAAQPAQPTMEMQVSASPVPRSAEAELASLAANDRPAASEQNVFRAAESASVRAIELVEPNLAGSEDEGRSILSVETGKQVARSFGELAEMVETTARRSLDEIAEDLLRPMLQEWLDDNLPTLVERLVREEIERVARGPRR